VDLPGYLHVTRDGQYRTLGKAQRAELWSVFEKYRQELDSQGKLEWPDVFRTARLHIEENTIELRYRAIIVDEAQDFHPEEWKLIRALVPNGPNDIFLVGDAHQRIYGRRVVLSRYRIETRGRSQTLRINYRTTEQIRHWAVKLLHGIDFDDLDGDSDNQKGYRSLLIGKSPEICNFDSQEEAQDFICDRVKELIKLDGRAPEEICLVARKREMCEKVCSDALKKAGIPFVVLGKDKEPEGGGVRVATMHRVKGLEFACVIMVGINENEVPLSVLSLEGHAGAKTEREDRERSLAFVASTRARDTLIVVSWRMQGRLK
jgi:superfamily I DNA/RNA helicase